MTPEAGSTISYQNTIHLPHFSGLHSLSLHWNKPWTYHRIYFPSNAVQIQYSPVQDRGKQSENGNCLPPSTSWKNNNHHIPWRPGTCCQILHYWYLFPGMLRLPRCYDYLWMAKTQSCCHRTGNLYQIPGRGIATLYSNPFLD